MFIGRWRCSWPTGNTAWIPSRNVILVNCSTFRNKLGKVGIQVNALCKQIGKIVNAWVLIEFCNQKRLQGFLNCLLRQKAGMRKVLLIESQLSNSQIFFCEIKLLLE